MSVGSVRTPRSTTFILPDPVLIKNEATKNHTDEPPTISFLKKQKAMYCCIAKDYYSDYKNLVDSLQIAPRLITNKNGFKAKKLYTMSIHIKNKGLYPRKISIRTDSPEDIYFDITKPDDNRYVDRNETLELKMKLICAKAQDINRRRHIYIDCFHPNITFEVPIVVSIPMEEGSIPENITMPPSVHKDICYYELLIYNPKAKPVKIKIKNTNKILTVSTGKNQIIAPMDYIKAFITMHVKKLNIYGGFFNVIFDKAPPKTINLNFVPKSMSVHLSVGGITFGRTKFEREDARTLTICNESAHEVAMVWKKCVNESSKVSVASTVLSIKHDTQNIDELLQHAISMDSVQTYFSIDHEPSFPDKSNKNVQDHLKHFCLEERTALNPASSNEVTILFQPKYDSTNPFCNDAGPPYVVCAKAYLCFSDSDDCIESTYLILKGQIDGIDVEFFPKVLDFRKVYLGEQHCGLVKALNTDGMLKAKVTFADYDMQDSGGVHVEPVEGFDLLPCERGIFTVSFFAITTNRLSIKMRFSVENGGYHYVAIKGLGQTVQLRRFPQLVEFSSIPVAVPQKRYVLLMNPLTIPITAQVIPTEDGVETPLTLNIRESSEMLPITVRDPIARMQEALEELAITKPNDNEVPTDYELAKSYQSKADEEYDYSSQFEDEVIETIPQMAQKILADTKRLKLVDKSETDKRVIEEVMHSLLETDYFNRMMKHNNYLFMDWNELASDPKEVYCDDEIFLLRPNTGRSITIVLIPNKVGYFHRSLTLRICPATGSWSKDYESSSDLKPQTLVDSDFLTSKVWFEYNCCLPDIEWNNRIDLTNQIIYAGEPCSFDMAFTNFSTVGGFFYFEVVPSEVKFTDNIWKFYISGGEQIVSNCTANFRSLGAARLSGMLKIVGYSQPFPFHLHANVLPPEIRVTPRSIHRRIRVWETNHVPIYIDNLTPTHTKLTMSLQDETFQILTKYGAMLDPEGQSMYMNLISIFPDPDTYLNTLTIDLQFENVVTIPISFLVEGVPIYFEPNIINGFDAGVMYTDTLEEFNANYYNHRFPIKVTNRGLRSYHILINRLKTSKGDTKMDHCATQALTARFDMRPKCFELAPESDDFLDILVSATEEGVYYCNFMVDVKDAKHPNRKYMMRVTVKATFLDADISWSRKEVSFNFCGRQPLSEAMSYETVLLTNLQKVPIDMVSLEAVGPFRIKDQYETEFVKHLELSLAALQKKEIFITAVNSKLKQYFCKPLEGRINVWAVGKARKCLYLKIIVKMPEVTIPTPELLLFSRAQPYDYKVPIMNTGCCTAEYKWKRIEVVEQYIGTEDDAEDCIGELLSDIIGMLEYNFSCDAEPNLTRRYQQCCCQHRSMTETGYMVVDIIDEIISKLDLEHKRYKLDMFKFMDVSPMLYQSEYFSTSGFIRYTLDDIIDQLQLEPSEAISSVSSEHCFNDRDIYFYKKASALPEQQQEQCLLHLPCLRRSHELKALFQLAVCGGRAQVCTVTLVNLTKIIKLQKDNNYLGIKPWYELFSTVIHVSNVTKYPLKLVTYDAKNIIREKLIDGFVRIIENDKLQLEALGNGQIKLNGIMGFSENFMRSFYVLINDTACNYFLLRGQGVLPILNMCSKLPSIEQDPAEILEEYELMRRIYAYEFFKSLNELDIETLSKAEELEHDAVLESQISVDFTGMSISEKDMSSEQRLAHDMQLLKMLRTYVIVDNNQELPNDVVLEQLLDMERYKQRLATNSQVYKLHKEVYQDYAKNSKRLNCRNSTNVKHFMVQPIPLQQHGYIIDLGEINLNMMRRATFKLHFFGPGKLIAMARTAVRIPGLYVDFNVENHSDKKFTYWAEKCRSPEFFDKKYRNIFERLLDTETAPRLKHAHSFDLDEYLKHKRTLTGKHRRMITEYYNSLNPSVYPDHKHHFILAKIFTAHQSNFSGVDLNVSMLYKPEAKYYTKGQLVEDYIYIDLHMGPTLPILLRGVLK